VRTLVSRGREGCRSGDCWVDGGIPLAHVLESSSCDPHTLVLCIDGQSHSRAACGRRHRVSVSSRISRFSLVDGVEIFRTSSTSIAIPLQRGSGCRDLCGWLSGARRWVNLRQQSDASSSRQVKSPHSKYKEISAGNWISSR